MLIRIALTCTACSIMVLGNLAMLLGASKMSFQVTGVKRQARELHEDFQAQVAWEPEWTRRRRAVVSSARRHRNINQSSARFLWRIW